MMRRIASPPVGRGRASSAGEGPNSSGFSDLRRNRKSRRTNVARPNPLPSWGEGIGELLLISMLALTASCAQVHEQMFTLDCAIGRPPLPGELAPGTAIALDVSTSPIPLLFPPHRAIARCDSAGVVTMNIETPVDTGLSQLSTPLSTAASHVTYVP